MKRKNVKWKFRGKGLKYIERGLLIEGESNERDSNE